MFKLLNIPFNPFSTSTDFYSLKTAKSEPHAQDGVEEKIDDVNTANTEKGDEVKSQSSHTEAESMPNTNTNPSRRNSFYEDSIISSSQADLGIAMILRSKQERRMGNNEMANRLYVDGLEQLANAVTETSEIENQQQRERLEMLKLILGNGGGGSSNNITCLAQKYPPNYLIAKTNYTSNYPVYNVNPNTTVGERVSEAAWFSLAFMFALFGDAVVWAATAFQESRLPELTLHFLAWLFHTTCYISSTFKIPERSIAFGQYVANNFISLDQKTMLSQKMYLALFSVFQTMLGFVEIKSTANNNNNNNNRNNNNNNRLNSEFFYNKNNHEDNEDEYVFYREKLHVE
ncbi:hypothetical protein H4219_000579 [Mycoemilia scoparia]|uniref:Uncharacterized protein n=1 Tax=Mycoemilia scoparia TaxID=417184 RepID=A0A9W8A859_9FUNG|nr:hypothetical protein H4219_000579 [Mycoemilia scoparia]